MAESIDVNLGRHAVALAEQEWGSLKPLGEHFRPLVSQPMQMCEVAGDWFVVSVEPRQHELAKHEITNRGLVPYLPIEPRRERHGRGQKRTVRRPMLGPYMLVRCRVSEQDWSVVKAARGVRRFLGSNGRPIAIDHGAVEVIRLKEAEFAEEEWDRAYVEAAAEKAKEGGRSGIIWHFSEGDRVRIKTGPFAAFYAQLESAVDVRDRITALVSVFGRQSVVELSAFDIEAL